jgi:hypothetical protein
MSARQYLKMSRGLGGERPRIERLRRDHHVDLFDCGQEAPNRFLVRYAFQSQQAEGSRTCAALVGDEVVGHPIPLTLLARLAAATSWQGRPVPPVRLSQGRARDPQAAVNAGRRGAAGGILIGFARPWPRTCP